MAAPPDDDAHRQIRTALNAARAGGATLNQLADAHKVSEEHGLHHCTAEIREHMRRHIPDPNRSHVAVGRSVALGILSGVITHYLLRLTEQKARLAYRAR